MKKELRKKCRELRKEIPFHLKEAVNRKVTDRVLHWPLFQKVDKILLYSAIQNEVSCDKIIEKAWKEKKRVCLPKVIQDNQMEIYQIKSWRDLSPGAYGVLEPDSRLTSIVSPAEIDLAFIPGVAFDFLGYRLGFGGGYYDRFLESNPAIIRVGITYQELMVSTVYPEAHDQSMDYIISESQILSLNSHRLEE